MIKRKVFLMILVRKLRKGLVVKLLIVVMVMVVVMVEEVEVEEAGIGMLNVRRMCKSCLFRVNLLLRNFFFEETS